MSSAASSGIDAHFPTLRKLTPVLAVERVEDCTSFWIERLGFAMTNQVPGDDGALVFAILERGDIEVMYQTRASILADGAMTQADWAGHSVALFIAVDSIDDVERAMAEAEVVKPRHDTFYGSTEIYVKEPGGNVVGFSQMR